ncbi:MAG: ATP-dependent zinc metalloprotease FtsH [Bacteroidales bacterium]|nr:ATP-dependent zinc metalloprotease FtsH [Bacteroidales bacterium]
MYAIYGAVLIALAVLFFGGDGHGNTRSRVFEISWNELDDILRKGDQDKIVVVDRTYAEIYIKDSVLRSDTTYKKLANRFTSSYTNPGHFKYKFVDVESFKKDLDQVANDNFTRDTLAYARTHEGTISQETLNAMRRSNHIEMTARVSDHTFEKIAYWFGPLLLLVIMIIVFNRIANRQMGGGGGGIFNVGKSKAKVYDGKTSTNVTFKDVAGLAGAKEEVVEVVDFLKNPKKYTALGGKIPKGVLLVGPPGTGKTLLAKAVAGEANVPFFSMSGSDFVEMFVGVGASRVRDLFEEAKKKAPCIIFIDEIDAVGRARGRGGINSNDERENTLNQLLTEMDGFGTNNGVIVMAATNRADVLDKALLRAGRFDRQIYVELPDIDERKAIFEVHMRNLKLAEDVDKDFLSKQTPGFSGADIANVCNEAALVAARKEKKTIEKQDFLDAIDRIVGGLEKRTKVLTPEEKRTIAYHESGHASVSWQLRWGNPLVKVTIVPRGKALGAAWYLPEERQITTYEQMFDEVVSLVAGRAAEEIVFGKISTGALNDLERATKMVQAMVVYYGMSPVVGNLSYYDSTGQSEYAFSKPWSEKTSENIDAEVKRMVDEAYQRAKDIILASRDKLDELANLLFEREVIFREDVERIYGKRPWDEEKEAEKANTEETVADDVATTETATEASPAEPDPTQPDTTPDNTKSTQE